MTWHISCAKTGKCKNKFLTTLYKTHCSQQSVWIYYLCSFICVFIPVFGIFKLFASSSVKQSCCSFFNFFFRYFTIWSNEGMWLRTRTEEDEGRRRRKEKKIQLKADTWMLWPRNKLEHSTSIIWSARTTSFGLFIMAFLCCPVVVVGVYCRGECCWCGGYCSIKMFIWVASVRVMSVWMPGCSKKSS